MDSLLWKGHHCVASKTASAEASAFAESPERQGGNYTIKQYIGSIFYFIVMCEGVTIQV